jgi:hypothetical protein
MVGFNEIVSAVSDEPGEACKDVIVIFMFVKGVFVSVGM